MINIDEMKPKSFTSSQLAQISDKNYEILNQCVDTEKLKCTVYICIPVMLHDFAFGVPVDVHLRTLVIDPVTTREMAYQDMTFSQWEEGLELLTT